ncbi:uncharacterized protein [Aegilops tauschii subsp. strangulata]|uniref:uncharacterized protein n=1 Tax=Aegilops tauschii subsp. strangulata TaxID=200361 RepID=UPI003CC8A5EF
MRTLFWNIRGFGQDGRRRQLIEYMRNKRIDIVTIQETMRTEFSISKLEHLSSDLFAWHWLPSSGSTGHSGGILLGVKDATFEVGSMDRGGFFVSMEIFERALNFKWEVIAVFGRADHRRSEAFLAELRRKVAAAQLQVVVGGDFNLIRSEEDKNNNLVNFPRMQMFNDCIADMGLRELDRVGAKFTWTNRQADPTRSVLDRVLWLRGGVRHAMPPIDPSRPSTPGNFCAKRSRQFMKGWGANVGRDIRERKKALLEAIQSLDLCTDAMGLSADEWMLRYDLEDQLTVIYTDEEAY